MKVTSHSSAGVELKYLDDRPVFPRERAMAEAWARGGTEAENEERQNWINKERRRVQEAVQWVTNLRKNAEERKKSVEKEGEGDCEDQGVDDVSVRSLVVIMT